MTNENLADRFRKLARLATDPRTPPAEAALAGAMADKLLELNPDLESIGTGDDAEIDVTFRNSFEEHALSHIGGFLALKVYNLRGRLPGGEQGRKIRALRLAGPADVIALVPDLWQFVRAEMKAFLRGASAGWLWGSMPFEVEGGGTWKPTETELKGYIAGNRAADEIGNPTAPRLKG